MLYHLMMYGDKFILTWLSQISLATIIEGYVFFFHLLTQILRFALACCIPFRLTNDTNDDDIGRNSRNDSNVEVR